MNSRQIIRLLRSHADPASAAAMARFGIHPRKMLGVRIPILREIAAREKKNSRLASALWKTGIHEARILAGMVEDPGLFTEKKMEQWVKGFDSWDICDQCCMNLFEKTPFAWQKAFSWAESEEEFVKRAGFVLMARLALSDKKSKDEDFLAFFPLIRKKSEDKRNFVKKAVNWALRQIGKRSLFLHGKAVQEAEKMRRSLSASARWIASGALRELKSESVNKMLQRKNLKKTGGRIK